MSPTYASYPITHSDRKTLLDLRQEVEAAFLQALDAKPHEIDSDLYDLRICLGSVTSAVERLRIDRARRPSAQ